MKALFKKIAKDILIVLAGLALFYCPVFGLAFLDGTPLSHLASSRFLQGLLICLYHPILETFIIPRGVLLGIWAALALVVLVSRGGFRKIFCYLYLVYSLLYSLVGIAFALATTTFPGDHVEQSPYPDLAFYIFLYCAVAALLWIKLPESFKG